MKKVVILDPGHGMANRKAGAFDPGAVSNDGTREADIAMSYANELRGMLQNLHVKTIRTRVSNEEPCPVSSRAKIARDYAGTIMISIHCNAADGRANGTETFYRGESNAPMARKINDAVCKSLGTKNRGVKTESASQHGRLAVMNFQPCFLIELGFIDHVGDREKMLSESRRKSACEALALMLAAE